jgi:hypothetical protein
MPAGSGPLPWLDRRWYDARPTTAEAEAFCRDLAGRH